MATDTGTTTGRARDDAAATTAGWQAHLHVTAVTGAPTSWTVKLQDSADGTIAGPTSPAPPSRPPTSRPRSGWSRRRGRRSAEYVRYVATVVGGTAPTITFGLAYARNR